MSEPKEDRIDILYVGELTTDLYPDIQLITEIGKAPLSWTGEFKPLFMIDTPDIDLFPAGIAMYTDSVSKPLIWEEIQSNIERSRFVLIIQSNQHIASKLRDYANNSKRKNSILFLGVETSKVDPKLIDENFPNVSSLCERVADPLNLENIEALAKGYLKNNIDVMTGLK